MQRYFRTDAVTYESVRQSLDDAFGHPNDVAQTAFDPATSAPRDSDGRCLLAVRSEFCDWPQVAAVLPGLLASGAVEEIDEATYRGAVESPVEL